MAKDNQVDTELRAKVIHAVCFKPNVMGHIEQFEAIEALIQSQLKAYGESLIEKMPDKIAGCSEHPFGTSQNTCEEWFRCPAIGMHNRARNTAVSTIRETMEKWNG